MVARNPEENFTVGCRVGCRVSFGRLDTVIRD